LSVDGLNVELCDGANRPCPEARTNVKPQECFVSRTQVRRRSRFIGDLRGCY
jgi:hypothetical protein